MPYKDDSGYVSEDTMEALFSSDAGPSNYANKTRRPIEQKDLDDCMRVLTQVFGHSNYKGKQKEIVEAAYGGADILVVAPTGMGKSLCFQIPAIADKRGLTIVVSPLLALMQNQLDNLHLKNVEMVSLSSQNDLIEKQESYKNIKPALSFYTVSTVACSRPCLTEPNPVTPERLSNPEFKEILDVIYSNYNLNRLVVDEAHCISEWGHDFRSEYRKIGNFRKSYPDIPIMALTATATSAVQKDIIRNLKLDDKHLFIALHPFNRKNLYYEVRYLSNPERLNQMADVFDFITTLYRRRGRASSGIIYCRAKKTCDELSSYLRGKGLNAKPYHRGIPSATLDKTLRGWTAREGGGPDVVVATIAFGLGIDKADVRYIVHFDLPKSFEGYYQETGRAGRDGHPAKCVLYYSREDAIILKRLVGNKSNPNRIPEEGDDGPTPTQRATSSLEALVQLAENHTLCRHVAICRYFGESIDEEDEQVIHSYCNNMCDVCKFPEKTKSRIAKLSSREQAVANTPPLWQTTHNAPAAQSRQTSFNSNEQRRPEGPFAGQKRPASDFTDSAPKKRKVTSVPVLVTKPFQSASRLSKPFRPPAFIQKPDTSKSLLPSIVPAPQTEPLLQRKEPITKSVDMDVKELSPDVDLPDVDLFWDPEHSSKASAVDREDSFQGLRRSLHNVLISGLVAEAYWSKICKSDLDENRRNEVVFETAKELEFMAISLSSTLDGYKIRIESIRKDIKALSDLSLWDSRDSDFEDSQDIIACLRRLASSLRKGKGKGK
ncbi:P-loop containing nucleoside triphosphate hydrolase protein [Gymnopilus junonius]|uniref:ATP-dependent DNA helicase n=1 Tax=Gymnopilus junonius TaxID=109634 RepID=A0A9P5NUI1_GYMJU|nr:P-loop containing nucleoside triphosphate hydrolase protein [Gymnopilus junonius]